MGWFNKRPRLDNQQAINDRFFDAYAASSSHTAAPPEWAPAEEQSRAQGLLNDAPEEEFEMAELFCRNYPPYRPALLPSYDVEKIKREGCKAWGMSYPNQNRFIGAIRDLSSVKEGGPKVVEITTEPGCGDVSLMSNFPIMGGLYETQGKEGVYFEVTVKEMGGVVAIGTLLNAFQT